MEFRIEVLAFGVWGFGFGVWGFLGDLEVRVWGLGGWDLGVGF